MEIRNSEVMERKTKGYSLTFNLKGRKGGHWPAEFEKSEND